MTIETDRTLIRPFRKEDLHCLTSYVLEESFWRYLPIDPPTEASVAAFLRSRLEEEWGKGGYHGALIFRDMDRLIGTVRLSQDPDTPSAGDLGFALNPAFSGAGLMSEAVQALVGVGWSTFAFDRIWATADVDNRRSWKLMERVGMIREGILRRHKVIRGDSRDSYIYAIYPPSIKRRKTGKL